MSALDNTDTDIKRNTEESHKAQSNLFLHLWNGPKNTVGPKKQDVLLIYTL